MATSLEDRATTLDFSTDNLPVAGRAGAIRDYLADLMRVDVHALDPDSPLHYRARLRMLDGASWGSALVSSIVSSRTNQLIKDGQDDLMLGMSERDMVIELPNEGEMKIRPGEAFVLSFARAMRLTVLGSGRLHGLRIPRRPIAQILPRISSAPVMLIRDGTPVLSLLCRYMALLEDDPLIGNLTQQTAARHLQEMLALVVGASGEFQEQAERDSVAAVRLMAVKDEISKNLSNTNLGIKWIANQQHVSPRYLQRLFAQVGTSFSNVLRQARVARARALLENPLNRNRTILSIALECGFPEASALNHAFRQEYGLKPSDVRWRG